MNERVFARRDTHAEVTARTGREPPGPNDVRTRLPGKSRQPSKTQRQPKRPGFDRVVLLLQGGGALGAYQGGVYEALAEA
ncbi:MAG: hypothetical protein WCA56_03675, partial [Xanthobacteraceae bacterium]